MAIIHCINFIVNILIIIMVSNRVGHKKAITRVTPVIAASVFILSVSLFVIVCVV